MAQPRGDSDTQAQSSRCVECGTPFCHWRCPLGNQIPDWNDALANGQWAAAYEWLRRTNNFPEITGRLCPAPCEASCILALGHEAVTIRENELAIIEHAFQHGLVQPRPPAVRTGRSVAVIGSGPAGLAGADQLNQAGHRVVVFERDPRAGGLLRCGIPDFKLDKGLLDRRLALWRAEGIEFATGTDCVGTAVRQGARRVVQLDLLARPPDTRAPADRWPRPPTVLKTSTSHEEGCVREMPAEANRWSSTPCAMAAGPPISWTASSPGGRRSHSLNRSSQKSVDTISRHPL